MHDSDPAAVEPVDVPAQADEHGQRAFWTYLSAAAGLYRWILASLVTLNGGAIVALGSWHERFEVGGLKSATMLFFFGSVFAVLAAMAGAVALLSIGNELGSGRYRLAALNTSRKGERMNFSDTLLAAGPLVLSAVSLAFFVFGGLAASGAFAGSTGPLP